MSKQFVRLAADIVIANSTGKGFTTEQLTQMLKEVADTLEGLAVETGGMAAAESTSAETAIPTDWKASIGKNTITCMICGYSGKILTPHLKSKHQDNSPGIPQAIRDARPDTPGLQGLPSQTQQDR